MAAALAGVLLLGGCDGEPITGGSSEPGAAPVASTAVTSEVDLSVPAGVKAKCGLTMLTDGKLIVRCRFTNTNPDRVRFLYCMMMDLTTADQGASVPGLNGQHIVVHQSGTTVDCTKSPAGQFSQTSFHFGCEEVDLQAGETKIITFESAGAYKPPSGVTVTAQDFQVSYADSAIVDPAHTYDPTNCRLGAGEEQAGFVTFGQGDVGAYWVVAGQPFVDPFVARQDEAGKAGPKEYSLFEDSPCTPRDLEARLTDLDPCPVFDGEAPPVAIDLNLFYHESHMAERGTTFPALIEVEATGDARAVRIETDPPEGEPFEIPGGQETYGTLRACAEEVVDRCVAPEVEEGARLHVVVDFLHPRTRELLFPQVVDFFADTEPPVVESVEIDGGTISVTASDEATTPVDATLWISTDEGETWETLPLTSRPSITELELQEDVPRGGRRAFFGNLPEDVKEAQYVVGVQDLVFNLTFLGPQEV
ncbi:MAG: hypothetical protein ABR613_05585 [Actinomycetota bacterium]